LWKRREGKPAEGRKPWQGMGNYQKREEAYKTMPTTKKRGGKKV